MSNIPNVSNSSSGTEASGNGIIGGGNADCMMASVLNGLIDQVETLSTTTLDLSELQQAQQSSDVTNAANSLAVYEALEAAYGGLNNTNKNANGQDNYQEFNYLMNLVQAGDSGKGVLSYISGNTIKPGYTSYLLADIQSLMPAGQSASLNGWTAQQMVTFCQAAGQIGANAGNSFTAYGAQQQSIQAEISQANTDLTNIQTQTVTATSNEIQTLSTTLSQLLAGLAQVIGQEGKENSSSW